MDQAPGNLFPFLRPGLPFIALLTGFAVAGLGLHAWALRRLGTERLDALTRRVEGTLFCLILGLMLALSGLQVFLRNLFHSGLLWIDPFVRTLVLWVAFLGAMAATSHVRHLHIDVWHRALPPRIGRKVSRGLSLVSASCCAFLANGAYIYLGEERLHGVSPFLDVPSWVVQSILLWGFALLAYRFLVQAIWPSPEKSHP